MGTEVTAASWPHSPYGPIRTIAPSHSHPCPSAITLSHPVSIISSPQPSQIHPISVPPHPLPFTSPISASIPCPFHILISSRYHPSPIPYPYFIPNHPMLIPCPSRIDSIFQSPIPYSSHIHILTPQSYREHWGWLRWGFGGLRGGMRWAMEGCGVKLSRYRLKYRDYS